MTDQRDDTYPVGVGKIQLVLADGKASYGELLVNTGLTDPCLNRVLKRAIKSGSVACVFGPSDEPDFGCIYDLGPEGAATGDGADDTQGSTVTEGRRLRKVHTPSGPDVPLTAEPRRSCGTSAPTAACHHPGDDQ